MALKSTTVPVTFSGGLDSKTAEQLVVPGKFLVLENCVRRKAGKVQKRHGFTALGTGTVSRPAPLAGVAISEGRKLATLGDELILVDSNSLYSYSESGDNWIYKGEAPSLAIESVPVVRNSHRQAMPDGSTLLNTYVTAWEDSRGGVRCSVYDYTTGASLMYDTEVSATGSRPKVVTIKRSAFIIYLEGTELKYKEIQSVDPTVFASSSSASWVTSVADVAFDVYSVGDYAVFSVNKADTSILVGYIGEDGAIGNGSNGLPNTGTIAAGTAGTLGSSIYADNVLGSKYVYVLHMTATVVKCTAFATLLAVQSTVNVETAIVPRNCTATLQTDATELTVVYENTDADGNVLRAAGVTFDGTTATVTTAAYEIVRSVGLASKLFESNDNLYVCAAFQSSIQPTYFVVRVDGFVAARIAAGLGDGYTRDSASPGVLKTGLPRIFLDESDFPQALFITSNRQAADEGGTVSSISKGVQKTTMKFGTTVSTPIEAGNSVILPGGTTFMYDGVSTVEAGFHVYPEVGSISVGGSGGSFSGAATYYYRVVYEWVDAQGQVHRSAPSVTQSADITGATDEATLTIPYLRLTSKCSQQGRADAVVVIFRSTADQASVFYRLTEITNDIESDTITYVDDNSDASGLSSREVLYTTGGVLENTAPTSCKVALNHKNRVFLAGLENVGQISYSKEIVEGEGVTFSDTFVMNASKSKGGVTALGPLDDKLVIFKKDSILGVVGDGPLDTGAQNDFSKPQQVASDVGCSNQDSILLTPAGLMFQSDKGIYILTRDLSSAYIGAPVEEFNSYTITSSNLVEDVNEARFTTANGPTLVYNYQFDQWSIFTNYEAQHAINALDSYLHLKSDGRIMKEDTGYTDNGSRIAMAIETSWLALNGLQGYQRIYQYEFLGDFVSDHVTRVKLAYDYEDFFTQTVYFNVGESLLLETYGEDATYGTSSVYGGSGSTVYQFNSKPRRQKCGAIKFRLEDLDTLTANGGGSFNLVSLALTVGIKDGLNKYSKSREI